jgi:RHS repeat-associated protein
VEDDAGRELWRARIDPYGRAHIGPDAAIELNLRWPGHYFDAESGLHYNRHRYYSPELARYIQVDPRDLEGGINVYAYSSRPLDRVDVDGLVPCPKLPMVTPKKNDKAFQRAKKEADKVANNLKQAVKDAVDNEEMHPLNAKGLTLSVLVVLKKNGKYEVVVTSNRNPGRLPESVQEAAGDHRVIGWGDDDRPPAVRRDRDGDDDWMYGRKNQAGNDEDTTHSHAEQRGLRTVDCDENAKGVAYVAPTRPCCQGCSNAIQTPTDDGGWGGDSSNVSDLGRQPGQHGNWWDE